MTQVHTKAGHSERLVGTGFLQRKHPTHKQSCVHVASEKQAEQTSDEAVWGSAPRRGIKLAMAQPSKMVVLDIESQHPTDHDELESFFAGDSPPHPHHHYSSRAPWLRAGVLGANDGLVSIASLMLGVGGGTEKSSALILAGVSGLVGGALSMAVGEYISVSSQRDAETADIQREIAEQEKGPEAQRKELRELAEIYRERGLSAKLSYQVAVELTAKDVVRAHARDELGIDMDDLSNPWKAAGSSAVSFVVGAGIPLLAAAFIKSHKYRLISLAITSTVALLAFGAIGAWLGGAGKIKPAVRVLLGGWLAMLITFGVGKLFTLA